MTVDREEALETTLGQIERTFGKGSVMKMSDRPQVSIGAVSRAHSPSTWRSASAGCREGASSRSRPRSVGQDDVSTT